MAFLLSESDVAILKEMATAFRNGRLNLSSRSGEAPDDHQAPETYIAIPDDEEGIPAFQDAVGTGTGTGPEEGDVPGSGLCTVYKILDDAIVLVGRKLKVYNLTSSIVERNWLTVIRDKFGTWLIASGGGVPPKPYIITQRDEFGTGTGTSGGETGLLAAIYFGEYPEFWARPCKFESDNWIADETKDEELVRCDFQNGVMFTDDLILVHTINGEKVARGGHTLSHFLTNCQATENIAPDTIGEVYIALNPFDLSDAPIVAAHNKTVSTVFTGQSCSLLFDSKNQSFVIVLPGCAN